MVERSFYLETRDGSMDCFSVHPEEGGPFPSVLFYMDAPAIREELRDMARRLGSAGYFVLLPNLFYRVGTERNYPFDQAAIRRDPKQRQIMADTMADLTNAKVINDTETMLGYLVREEAATQSTAALGYCMSGQYVVAVMGAYPEAFSCGASYYGVRIVTDEEDSPHLKADQIKGELYLAFAERDHWVPDDTLERIRHVFTGDGRAHRIEVYPGTEHGFAFWKRPVYHREGAERHWERMHHLFRRNLMPPEDWGQAG